jgi:hypothetical protein
LEAIISADLRTLRILHRHGCLTQQHEEEVCKRASKYNREEILFWAHSEGFSWNVWTCAYAAENGNLELLRWLRERGCPWDEKTCARAAQQGNLEILRWVLNNDDPPPAGALVYHWAKWNGNDEVLKWLELNHVIK